MRWDKGDLVGHKENRMLYRVVRRMRKGLFGWMYEIEPVHSNLTGVTFKVTGSELFTPPKGLRA